MEISLAQFIQSVKSELQGAQSEEAPFYELTEVELEVAFAMSSETGGGFKFVVFDLGGKASETATHRVRLKLDPLPTDPPTRPPSGPRSSLDEIQRRLRKAWLESREAESSAHRVSAYAPQEQYWEDMETIIKEVNEKLKKSHSRPRYRRR